LYTSELTDEEFRQGVAGQTWLGDPSVFACDRIELIVKNSGAVVGLLNDAKQFR